MMPVPSSISTADYGNWFSISLIILSVPEKFVKREKKNFFFMTLSWDIGMVGQILPHLA